MSLLRLITFRQQVGPPALWTPAEISTSLWLDASDSSTIILNGSNVSQWNDKRNNGAFISQATATNQPILGTNNGRPAVNFDGINDFMIQNATNIFKMACFVVMGYPNNNSSPPFVFSGNNADSSNRIHELHLMLNGSIRAVMSEVGPYADTPTGTPQSNYTNSIVGCAFGPASDNELRAQINGLAVSTNANPTDGTTTQRALRFGQRGDNNFSAAISLTEVVVIENWTVVQLQLIEGYLAHKWGLTANLPVEHPYKTTPPYV